MNLWGTPDRLLSIMDTADRHSGAEELIATISVALSVAGEYVARVDHQPTQRIVDFNWAARQAGRRLGIQVDVTSRIIKASARLEVFVRVLTPPK